MDEKTRFDIVFEAYRRAVYKERMLKCLKIVKSFYHCDRRISYYLWVQYIVNSIHSGETTFFKKPE